MRPPAGILWEDSSLSLARFGVLRSLTLHEHPALVSFWLSRLPVSLERLMVIAASRSEADTVVDDRSAVNVLPHITPDDVHGSVVQRAVRSSRCHSCGACSESKASRHQEFPCMEPYDRRFRRADSVC